MAHMKYSSQGTMGSGSEDPCRSPQRKRDSSQPVQTQSAAQLEAAMSAAHPRPPLPGLNWVESRRVDDDTGLDGAEPVLCDVK